MLLSGFLVPTLSSWTSLLLVKYYVNRRYGSGLPIILEVYERSLIGALDQMTPKHLQYSINTENQGPHARFTKISTDSEPKSQQPKNLSGKDVHRSTPASSFEIKAKQSSTCFRSQFFITFSPTLLRARFLLFCRSFSFAATMLLVLLC